MASLYNTFLPLVQSLNDYGGNVTARHIREPLLNAMDVGASVGEPSLVELRNKLLGFMKQWKGLQDHKTFKGIFETYYEGVFYLVAQERGVPLLAIAAGAGKGSTPDFRTVSSPTTCFEIKTIDIAEPDKLYDQFMLDGLNAKLEAQAKANKTGVGSSVQIINPHGSATNYLEVVEQVMKKIGSNIKSGQYEAAPTFLVVSLARTAVHSRAENLRKLLPQPNGWRDSSGQLFAIAANRLGASYYDHSERTQQIDSVGELNRAGILLDHPYIAGLIFLHTESSERNSASATKGIYALNGIWNVVWEKDAEVNLAQTAKAAFERLCDAWNDTEDSRSALLPV